MDSVIHLSNHPSHELFPSKWIIILISAGLLTIQANMLKTLYNYNYLRFDFFPGHHHPSHCSLIDWLDNVTCSLFVINLYYVKLTKNRINEHALFFFRLLWSATIYIHFLCRFSFPRKPNVWHQASSAKMMCVTYGKSRAVFRYTKEKRAWLTLSSVKYTN